jgi:hypothetical protein
MALNKPEWLHSVIGCLAATAVGCTLPAFAVLFGEVIGVSVPKKDFIVGTLIKSVPCTKKHKYSQH